MEAKYEFVIKVDNKEVWRGINPKQIYTDLSKNNPGKRVSVSWETREDVLICVLL